MGEMYEIIKKVKWKRDYTSGNRFDGYAETVYMIKQDGVLRDEEFSSMYEANKYINTYLTKVDEVVHTRFCYGIGNDWKAPSIGEEAPFTDSSIQGEVTADDKKDRVSSDGTIMV